jgi:antitoxin YefM
MVTMTASRARKELYPLLGQVNEDRDVVRITSNAGNGVLMSEADFDAWQTTLYLFSTPANARRLMRSYEQARAGKVEVHELDLS